MKKVQTLLTALFLIATVSGLQGQQKYEIVEEAGQLSIKGTSNTADWELLSGSLTGDAQLMVENGDLTNVSRVIVDIDGKTIANKNNKRMTKKAQKTLQIGAHPVVTFFAYGFSQMADGPRKMKGNVSIAGKNVDILFDFTSRIQDDVVWIVAEADAKFSDFGLEPPTDFGGAITCKDDIKIEVQLPFSLPEERQ